MNSSKIIIQDFSKKQQEFFFIIDIFTYICICNKQPKLMIKKNNNNLS